MSAVYNVAPYLDAYFESLVSQTVDFERSIEIILVDDGSTDESAQICEMWRKKYPSNIRLMRQENAGQGAARNAGMPYATGEWITFIDPDDFLDKDYFKEIDKVASGPHDQPLRAISANLIFFHEKTGAISDSHALRFRYANGLKFLPLDNLEDYIQLSASSLFLERSSLISSNIYFDDRIKPSFEDAHFLNKYLIDASSGLMAFVPQALYIYRKRESQNSTLDTAWEHKGRYSDQLEYGYLDILEYALIKKGVIPSYVQKAVLYDLCWHFRRFINNKSLNAKLNKYDKDKYINLIRRIMKFIDTKIIIDFKMAGIWFYHKVGIINFFDLIGPNFNIVYIDDYDAVKCLVKIRYFTDDENPAEEFLADSVRIYPQHSTVRRHEMFGETFIFERVVWLRLGFALQLDARIGGLTARLSLRGRQYRNGLATSAIAAAFRPALGRDAADSAGSGQLLADARSRDVVQKYGNAWIFMDRDTQADDNAEHLYRHVAKTRPDVNVWFALRETSADWKRLKGEGFNLIAFGTREYKLALLNASHLISSHADEYIFDAIKSGNSFGKVRYRYTFLQHGVTKDDLSGWLNAKQIDLFVTATQPEFASIAGNGNYKFTGKEVRLTGFPRHDRLLRLAAQAHQPTLLIMPTWRQSLAGQQIGAGNDRMLHPDFADSLYTRMWRDFLHSPEIRSAAEDAGLKIVFFPHANIFPGLSFLDVPDYIDIATHDGAKSIQDYMASCSVLVTDYSSVAFEVAYLRKPIVYFQFDHDEVFNGGHLYSPGYFDYDRDGFGPVARQLPEAIELTCAMAGNGGVPGESYLQRMNDTFAFRDEGNCERVTRAIEDLDRSSLIPDPLADLDRLRKLAVTDDHDGDALRQAGYLLDDPRYRGEAAFHLARHRRRQGRLDEARSWLSVALEEAFDDRQVMVEPLESCVQERHWEDAHELLKSPRASALSSGLRSVWSARLLRMEGKFAAAGETLWLGELRDRLFKVEAAELASAMKEWDIAAERWSQVARPTDPRAIAKAAEAFRMHGKWIESYEFMNRFDTAQSPELDLERAYAEFTFGHWRASARWWAKVVESGCGDGDARLYLAKSLRKSGKAEEALSVLYAVKEPNDRRTHLQELALTLTKLEKWNEAAEAWRVFMADRTLRAPRDSSLKLAAVLTKVGHFDEANSLLANAEKWAGDGVEFKRLRAIVGEALLEREGFVPVNGAVKGMTRVGRSG